MTETKVRKVPARIPVERCSAPGCGDKIKPPDEMWERRTGDVVMYYHNECFENGQPINWVSL